MKRLKKMLALVMAICLVLGLTPNSVFAAEDEPLAAAIFASDIHEDSTSLTGSGTSALKSVLAAIGDNGITYNTMGFVGDTYTDIAGTMEDMTSAAQTALGQNAEVYYAWGDHDAESDISEESGLQYSGEYYYIYHLSDMNMRFKAGATANNVAAAISEFETAVASMDKTKVLFIMSHAPLHDRRDDNTYANDWYTAISAVAETMDVVVLWAHNHTNEDDTDRDAYYVEKDGSETMTIYNGDTITPNFTYMNAGYIYANGQSPSRKGVATTVEIYDDSMVFQDYNSSGEYADSNYSHNVTVAREFAVTTPTEQTFTFSDTTSEVTITAVATEGTITNVSGEVTTVEGLFTDYAAYEVTLTDYTAGDSVAVTMTVPDDMDTINLKVYSVVDGVATEITDYTFVDGVISFATTNDGIFVFGAADIVMPGDAVLTGLEITQKPTTTKYFTTENSDTILPLDISGLKVTATYTGETSGTTTKNIPWNEFGEITDGYAISVDMTQIGTQEVLLTYTYGDVTCTATFDITIYNKQFTTTDTNIVVEVNVPGVTEVIAEENTTDTAIASALEGLATEYVSYDFTLTGYNEGETVSVTIPVPESMQPTDGEESRLAAYHITDDGYADEKVLGTYADGKFTFEANQFSTWALVTLTDAAAESESGIEEDYTSTTTGTKAIYKLVSSLTAGEEYLIVNRNSSGEGYGLAGSTAGASVTVKPADDISDVVYIEDKGSALEWTASSDWSFVSGSYNLGYSNGLSFTTEDEWTFNNNRLYQSVRSGRNTYTYYLRCNNGTWSASTTSSNVYFYQKTEVEAEIETTDTVSLDAGEDKKVVIDTIEVETNTVTIDPTILFAGVDATSTFEALGGTYTYAVISDGKDILAETTVTDGVFSLNAVEGTATVRVYYTWTVGEITYKIWDTVNITTCLPYYTIDITDSTKPLYGEDGTTVTGYQTVDGTIALKGITAGQTYDLNHLLQYVGANGTETITDATVTWSTSNESVATVNEDGIVTLTGTGGQTTITVSYIVGNVTYTDTIKLTATTSQYYTPADGGENFPEYPNEGAVRFDKTATAVGNFSETGIAQVELSMTGVPYTTDNAMDVVVMLDMTGSMSDDGMTAAEEATVAFVEKIVKNEDGSYNKNRVAVYAFNSGSSSPYELVALTDIENDDELTAANTAIRTASEKQASGGTPFDEATKQCYDVLQAAKTDGIGNERQQFCVFMSDGGPTTYYGSDGKTYYGGNNNSGDVLLTACMEGYSSEDSSEWTFSLPTEYYTDAMKADGVTVYTVGLLLQTAPSNPAPYSSMTDSTYDSTTDSLTTIGSHYFFCSSILKQMATDESKYIDIFNVDNADSATAKFTAIAQSILEAAKNVTVTDKISDNYTLILELPSGINATTAGLTNQEFYIEVLEYALDSNHERTTSTSLMKLYLGKKDDGSYYAASDSKGTAFASPTYEVAAEGDCGYYNYVDINDDGTADTYVFVADGTGTHNMVSGASITGTSSADLIIETPYFYYDANTRILVWNTDKLSGTELALSYFLYLDGSAGSVGSDAEIDAGTYPTNDYAYITYENYLGNLIYQEFPVPQMTWNGAQVTYVFYLVNEAGQPVNKSGQVVDFANAVFVTAPVTESVVWNTATEEGTASLDVTWAASEVLPDGYTIYDKAASYEIHVYETETGELAGTNRFIIDGSESTGATTGSTTKVYNTKAGTKYSIYGTYASDGTVPTGVDADMAGFDFSNTTVAFAVTWSTKLVEDTVVVDFGLPVAIKVLDNDMVQATLNSVSKIGYASQYSMNTGVADTGFTAVESITLDNGDVVAPYGDAIYYVQKDMSFNEPATFYYDAQVTYYKDSNKLAGYIYSKVTVIPATSIYYEDSFVNLKTYSSEDGNNYTETDGWTTIYNDGKTSGVTNAVQDTDRPGVGLLDDADNLYGYDSAYKEMSQYSLGSANMISVNANKYGTAEFEFYGTGFDVISMTSNTTGTIIVDVFAWDNAANAYSDTATKSFIVDTYYGYARTQTGGNPVYEWTLVNNDPNALYQVPVMKVEDLAYGKYKACITAVYADLFDNKETGTYDFYLDAIRIYDPAGSSLDEIDDAIETAYVSDKELLPNYYQLRNWLITADTFNSIPNLTEKTDEQGNTYYVDDDGNIYATSSVEGIIFIDSNTKLEDETAITNAVTDYTNYGPNNELYLAPGQAVAFDLNAATNIPSGYEIDTVQIALKSVGGTAYSKIWNASASTVNTVTAKTISTATDMYYDITELNGKTVVIMNAGADTDSILSITNIKVTYKVAVSTVADDGIATTSLFSISQESAENAISTMSLRSVAVEDEDTSTGIEEDNTSSEESDDVVEDNNSSDSTENEGSTPSEDEESTPSEDENVPSEDEEDDTVSEEDNQNVSTNEDDTVSTEDISIVGKIINGIKNALDAVANWFKGLFGK